MSRRLVPVAFVLSLVLSDSARSAERKCGGVVAARHMNGIAMRGASGTSCATGREVMRSVGRWADSRRCFSDLCVREHRINRRFRCSVRKVGEADWNIRCEQDDRVVRGYTAE